MDFSRKRPKGLFGESVDSSEVTEGEAGQDSKRRHNGSNYLPRGTRQTKQTAFSSASLLFYRTLHRSIMYYASPARQTNHRQIQPLKLIKEKGGRKKLTIQTDKSFEPIV